MNNAKLGINRRTFLSYSSYVGMAAGLFGYQAAYAAQKNLDGVMHSHWRGYNNSIVIDGLSSAFDYQDDITRLSEMDLKSIKDSGVTLINATIPYPGDNFEKTVEKIAFVYAVVRKHNTLFEMVNTQEDILHCKKMGKVGIAMGFQSTEMIEDKLDRIQLFSNLGVRVMQLTYNQRSQFGDGGLEKDNRAITELGAQAIAEMERCGVLLDLSHSGQKTVATAIKQASKPLSITHTGCNSIYQHPRNNNDAELKAVADSGGVVGMYLMPFLWGGSGEITAEMFFLHLDHAINVCGEDHVGIGSDQGVIPVNDTPAYREMIRQEVLKRKAAGISAPGETPDRPPFIAQLNSARRMDLIAKGMESRGYGLKTIEKVIGANFYRLFGDVWG